MRFKRNSARSGFTTAAIIVISIWSITVARTDLTISGPGWKAWMDASAIWQNDQLYLPGQVNLATLPVNAPSGGWTSMYDTKGTACSVPATIEQLFSGGDTKWTYHGVSWFWKSVTVPAAWQGKVIVCRIEDARLRCELYINDKLAGYDLIGEVPYAPDVTKFVTYGAANRIALRLTNPGGDANLNRGWSDFFPFSWGVYSFPSSHDFTSIGGPVTLIAIDSTSIEDVFVKNLPPVGGKNVAVNVTINNRRTRAMPVTVTAAILPVGGGAALLSTSWDTTVAASALVQSSKNIAVPAAKLWDIDNPNLYYCRVSISGGTVSDTLQVRFGFRTFEVKAVNNQHNYYFNGKRLRIKSAIDWGFYALTGTYATDSMARKSVQAAKDIGHNRINFHRCVGEPGVLDYADRLGLFLSEEPGGFKKITMGSFGGAIILEKCRRMVLRDRNHPSLLIYCLSNEDETWDTLRQTALTSIHTLDPSVCVVNASCDSNETYHIRPYETVIRNEYSDYHTIGSDGRFNEKEFYTHPTTDDSRIMYWGEVACYTGPPNWYLCARLQPQIDGPGYDFNIYQTLHDKIAAYFAGCRLSATGSGVIRTEEDVSRQAGRGLMYINGRIGQGICGYNSNDGFAINGWSGGPHQEANPEWVYSFVDWESAIVDEGRNLKGPAADFAYWTRPLQVAIMRKNGKYFNPGKAAQLKVVLINEGKLPAGSYTLKLRVKDGDGVYTAFTKDQSVAVLGGDAYTQTIIDPLSVTMDNTWKGGYVTIEGKLYNGTTVVADGAEQVLLQNRGSYKTQLGSRAGAVFQWPAAKSALTDAGVTAADFSASLGKLDYIVLGLTQQLGSYHINCGGGAADNLSADEGFSGGSTYSTTDSIINNFGYPAALKTARFGDVTYTLPVPNGTQYTVKLYFAETFQTAANARLFNVAIQGAAKLTNFDIFTEAGGHDRGVEKVFGNIQVTGGTLEIKFTSVKDNAMVGVIVVESATAGPADTLPAAHLQNMLQRVRDDGTRLVVRLDSKLAEALYGANVLSQRVTAWGGQQKDGWNGNGWGYLDYFVGNQAVPSGTTIGTNSWEVPGDPLGFYPFKSTWPQGSYGAYFFQPATLLVLIGSIDYGKGTILLAPSYPVDDNSAFNDMLFYNMLTIPTRGTVAAGTAGPIATTSARTIFFTKGLLRIQLPDVRQPFTLSLVDCRGRTAATMSGRGAGQLSMKRFCAGSYIAVVTSGKVQFAEKFVIMQ